MSDFAAARIVRVQGSEPVGVFRRLASIDLSRENSHPGCEFGESGQVHPERPGRAFHSQNETHDIFFVVEPSVFGDYRLHFKHRRVVASYGRNLCKHARGDGGGHAGSKQKAVQMPVVGIGLRDSHAAHVRLDARGAIVDRHDHVRVSVSALDGAAE